jgi:hypothetical protein
MNIVGNICSALIIQPLARSTAYGDTRQQWLTPVQAGLTKKFTVSKEREIVNNNNILYRCFLNTCLHDLNVAGQT